MFLVLVLFTAVRVGIAAGARPYYEPPVHTLTSMSATKMDGKGNPSSADGLSVPPGAYIAGQDVLDATGRDLHVGIDEVDCGQPANCARYTVVTDYQPRERFWIFQLIEAGIYIALSALLFSLTYWRVVRRIT